MNFEGLRANQSPIPIPVKIRITTVMIRARFFFDNLLQHGLSSSFFELDGIWNWKYFCGIVHILKHELRTVRHPMKAQIREQMLVSDLYVLTLKFEFHSSPPKKLLIIGPKRFFSCTGPAAQTIPELIFHVTNLSQDTSVSLFVNEGINQRYLKNWADVADKVCFGRT